MNNENYLNFLQMINGIKIGDFSSRRLKEKHDQKEIQDERQNEQKEIIRRLRIQNKKLFEQSVILKKKLRQIIDEKTKIVEQLNDEKKLNKSLSDALGSCSDCWGEDPNCENCSGRGIPGWRRINSRMFNIHVFPALEKLYSKTRKVK